MKLFNVLKIPACVYTVIIINNNNSISDSTAPKQNNKNIVINKNSIIHAFINILFVHNHESWDQFVQLSKTVSTP